MNKKTNLLSKVDHVLLFVVYFIRSFFFSSRFFSWFLGGAGGKWPRTFSRPCAPLTKCLFISVYTRNCVHRSIIGPRNNWIPGTVQNWEIVTTQIHQMKSLGAKIFTLRYFRNLCVPKNRKIAIFKDFVLLQLWTVIAPQPVVVEPF